LEIRRSHEAGDRFGGVAEASFSTHLGQIVFLVCIVIKDYFVSPGNDSAAHSYGRISYNEEFSFDHGNVIRVNV